MANLLQKISWNENKYQLPDISGYDIEQGNDNYIADFGIGHESWNFNKNELIDGKVYGYLRANTSTLFNELHNIWFFSKNLKGELFLVGYYKDCKYLTDEERIELKNKMSDSGLLDKRINQIYRVLREEDDFADWTWEDIEAQFEDDVISYKLEVDPENVVLFEEKIPFTKEEWTETTGVGWQDRYGNYTFIPDIDKFKEKIVNK